MERETSAPPIVITLQIDEDGSDLLTLAEHSLQAQGLMVHRMIIAAENPLGNDSRVRLVLDRIHEMATSHQAGPILIWGVGLGATLALWLAMLDRRRVFYKEHQTKRGTIFEQTSHEAPPILSGVIAASPFIGFDLRLGRPDLGGGDRWWNWMLRLARSRVFGGLANRMAVHRPHQHGCWTERKISWAELARVLPFASCAQVIPSLKRPVSFVFQSNTQELLADLETRILSLNGSARLLGQSWSDQTLGYLVGSETRRILESEAQLG